jgi:outer membrane murein-binding lipoprotein Lpp
MASMSTASAAGSIQAAASSPSASASTAAPASLSAKIDALEQDIQDTKTKINTLDSDIAALGIKIADAHTAQDTVGAANWRIEASKLEARRDRLETMLIGYREAWFSTRQAMPSSAPIAIVSVREGELAACLALLSLLCS